MSSRKQQEKEARRRLILQKAQALFAQKGYRGTSMAEIARASEFAVGSLYSFFKSKEEILTTIFQEHIKNVLEQTEAIRANTSLSPKEKIEACMETLVRIYVENQDFFRIYVAEARGVDWGVRTEVGRHIYEGSMAYAKLVSEIIKEAINAGTVDKSLDPHFVALLLRFFIHSTASHHFYGGQELSLDELLGIAKRILFHGISPKSQDLKS